MVTKFRQQCALENSRTGTAKKPADKLAPLISYLFGIYNRRLFQQFDTNL